MNFDAKLIIQNDIKVYFFKPKMFENTLCFVKMSYIK